MQLRDAEGRTFDSAQIAMTLEGFDDPALGELKRVRLIDGTHRLVAAADLQLAAFDDTANAALGTWPVPPNAS